MHEQQFALAALPESPRVFRVQLRHYSLGHELHLHRRANPFVTKTFPEFDAMLRPQRVAAVMQAVEVCHKGFAENCRPAKGWKTWFRIAQWCNLDVAIQRLRSYMMRDDFRASWRTDDNHLVIRHMGAPELLRLYQFICDTIPEREIKLYQIGEALTAWDYPITLALMARQSRDESDGRLEIENSMTKTIEKHMDEVERHFADAKNGAGCPTP